MQEETSYKTMKQSKKRERKNVARAVHTVFQDVSCSALHLTLDPDFQRENRGTHLHIYISKESDYSTLEQRT